MKKSFVNPLLFSIITAIICAIAYFELPTLSFSAISSNIALWGIEAAIDQDYNPATSTTYAPDRANMAVLAFKLTNRSVPDKTGQVPTVTINTFTVHVNEGGGRCDFANARLYYSNEGDLGLLIDKAPLGIASFDATCSAAISPAVAESLGPNVTQSFQIRVDILPSAPPSSSFTFSLTNLESITTSVTATNIPLMGNQLQITMGSITAALDVSVPTSTIILAGSLNAPVLRFTLSDNTPYDIHIGGLYFFTNADNGQCALFTKPRLYYMDNPKMPEGQLIARSIDVCSFFLVPDLGFPFFPGRSQTFELRMGVEKIIPTGTHAAFSLVASYMLSPLMGISHLPLIGKQLIVQQPIQYPLGVVIDPTVPSLKYIPQGSLRVPVLRFIIKNANDTKASIQGITALIAGTANPNDFGAAYLTDAAGNLLGQSKVASTGAGNYKNVSFATPFSVEAISSLTLTISVDISVGAQIRATASFMINQDGFMQPSAPISGLPVNAGYFAIGAAPISLSAITVILPNGGTYSAGQKMTISWSWSNPADNGSLVDINQVWCQYDQCIKTAIISNLWNASSYEWIIPTTIQPGKYIIEVVSSQTKTGGKGQFFIANTSSASVLAPITISTTSIITAPATSTEIPISTSSQNIQAIWDQLKALQAQLVQLQTQIGTQSGFIYNFDRNLYFGMQNDPDVVALQNVLLREEVYSGPITGNFFNLTLQAVKSFQRKYGIYSTGFVGPLTRAKLNEIAR